MDLARDRAPAFSALMSRVAREVEAFGTSMAMCSTPDLLSMKPRPPEFDDGTARVVGVGVLSAAYRSKICEVLDTRNQ